MTNRQAPQNKTIEFKTDFLNRFNNQTALTFKCFCTYNAISSNTAYGWGSQLGIEINSQIQYVHLLDKRCLVDGYQQQCLIDGVSFKQYFDNVKSKYCYNTARSWLQDEMVTGRATAIITEEVHPGRSAQDLNILFKQWGVRGLDNVLRD